MTEHRIGATLWGVEEFLSGGELLDGLLEQLKINDMQQHLANLLNEPDQ